MDVNTAVDYSFKAQVLLSSVMTVNCSRLMHLYTTFTIKKNQVYAIVQLNQTTLGEVGTESAKCKIEFTSKLILSECVRADPP